MKVVRWISAIFAASLFASSVHAGVITVLYEGVITSSQTERNNMMGSHPAGTRVSGSFTFADSLPDLVEGSAQDRFRLAPLFTRTEFDSRVSDLSLMFAIDGGISQSSQRISPSQGSITRRRPEFQLAFSDLPSGQQFGLSLLILDDPALDERLRVSLSAEDLVGDLFTVLGGLNGRADQVLDFLNNPDLALGNFEGSFSYQRYGRLSGFPVKSSGTFAITSISATTTATDVPSPTFFSLFAMSLAGIALRRRVKNRPTAEVRGNVNLCFDSKNAANHLLVSEALI